jgi:drug/metabolite transporter (DMT)-like permease
LVISIRRGTLIRMTLLALIWGSSFLWIKLALHALAPIQIALVRVALGATVLLALCLTARQRLPHGRTVWAHLGVAAIFGTLIPFALLGVGQQTIDSGVTGVLNATTPLWALLIGIMVRTERRLSAVRLGGLLLGFTGTLLIFAPWQSGEALGWGALAILGATASYGLSYVYVGKFLSAGTGSPLGMPAAQLVAATAIGALVLPVAGLQPIRLEPLALVAVAVLGVFGTGIGFVLNYRLIVDEGATNAATVTYLLPVVSVLLGAVILQEHITLPVIAGMVVVLAGVGMSRWQRRVVPAEQPDSAPILTAPATRG